MEISQINSLISSLNNTTGSTTETSVQAENTALLTGETDDLHTPIIEAQKAELALNLAIQVRNKVVEAYNQVMNMQV
jgi:flagellar hook-basal body complex protein FliE